MVHILLSASPIPLVIVTIALLFRQRGSYFRPVRTLLIIAHSLLAITLILEFIREFVQEMGVVHVLTTLAVTAVALSVLPFSLTGIFIANGDSIYPKRSVLQALLSQRAIAVPMITGTCYIAALVLAAWVFTPFSFGVTSDSFGTSFYTIYQGWYSLGLFGALLFFVIYPMRLMILRSRQVRSEVVSKALVALPLAWLFIGISLYLFKVYLVAFGLQTAALGSLFAAIPWVVTAHFYSNTTILETLFETANGTKAQVPSVNPFSERLRVEPSSILGKKMLLEFEPSDPYLDSVRDFTFELSRSVVLVVTRSNSPLQQILSKQNGLRFLILSPATSYPREGEAENEILLPHDDDSIILDAINKTIHGRTDPETAVIFDIVSDLIMSFGNEKTYKLLVRGLEMFSSPKITALFLLNSGAYDSKLISNIRSLFAVHLRQEKQQLSMTRQI